MTVAELISRLRAMPQDLRVVVDGYEGDFDDPVIHEGWALIANNIWREEDSTLGMHQDVTRFDGDSKDADGELVIVIGR